MKENLPKNKKVLIIGGGLIGDAKKTGNAQDAIRDAYKIAKTL